MEPAEKIATAKRIEDAKLLNLAEESKKCESLVTQAKRQAAANGAMSGGLVQHCIHLRVDALRSIVEGMVSERERLINNVPMLAGKAELDELRAKLDILLEAGEKEIL